MTRMDDSIDWPARSLASRRYHHPILNPPLTDDQGLWTGLPTEWPCRRSNSVWRSRSGAQRDRAAHPVQVGLPHRAARGDQGPRRMSRGLVCRLTRPLASPPAVAFRAFCDSEALRISRGTLRLIHEANPCEGLLRISKGAHRRGRNRNRFATPRLAAGPSGRYS